VQEPTGCCVEEAEMFADLHAELVLEGGDVKGIALVGRISVLEELGQRRE
jgi:hypothetical protein